MELSASAPTAALTVRNDEDTPALVQADSLLWSQAEGEERLEATRDVIVSPTVFTLPPRGSQLVRVALRRAPDARRELSYRLALQEVPSEASANFTGLRVALRLTVPVFVQPAIAPRPDLEWSIARGDDGNVVLRAENQGEAHARVLGFKLWTAGGEGPVLQDGGAAYVLPGQYRAWTVQNHDRKTPDEVAASAAGYRLQARTEQGEFVTELTVAR